MFDYGLGRSLHAKAASPPTMSIAFAIVCIELYIALSSVAHKEAMDIPFLCKISMRG
jgi:hypothetical protein